MQTQAPTKRQVLNLLLKAKQHSDRKQYEQKNRIVRDLMQQSPQDWVVDDQQGRYKGVTHQPTRFRLHIDPAVIDPRVNSMTTLAKQAATIIMRKMTIRIGFSAKPTQSDEKMSCTEVLQDLLYNCIDASLTLKKCHWNAQGKMFKPLHDFLGEGYSMLDDFTDDLAERMATLDSPADGSADKVAARSALTALPTKFMQADFILDETDTRLKTLVDKFNKAISDTDDDPVTSNMLQDMTHKLEKYHWMLRRQKEKRQESAKEAAARVLMSFIRV